MRFSTFCSMAAALTTVASNPILTKRKIEQKPQTAEIPPSSNDNIQTSYGKPFAVYQPRAFVISMFVLERDPWLKAMDFVHNITIPGLSPEYPVIHCTTDYTVCQVTTGEGEINAASSISALALNPLFDLTKTYFLVAGIAGGEPAYTTLGGVTFAKYAVQVGLEYQLAYEDYHAVKPEWTAGYVPYGAENPNSYPGNVYGTEVFEINANLRDKAVALASNATLSQGNEKNQQFRELYTEPAARGPASVVSCDVLTSDNYFTGNVLGDYFANLTKLMTNGSATYCSTAQEDNATLEVLTRLDKHGLVDFDRIMVMRTISDFSRPPPSMNAVEYFFNRSDGGIQASLDNLVLAGTPIIHDILTNWDDVYAKGEVYASSNYVGDIFATLGGKPDFGKESFDVA
ncbi:uncharacterized protein LODBEIA_P60470 [Lodderomyces beijingensis]|uniref:Purine nucleoside permease n=1 Tax=Lodderomyces beijingensis TaxID=1775926 RepID=A0ABP0ZVH3_9ASCO